jgi:glycosyltransferase involved in cell wall biosynthesis
MENNQVLLSICIPTYNRFKALDGNLNALNKQISGKNLPLELIVSDNCSTDNTSAVVRKYIANGLSINYIRNSENIGMDRNFAQCYRQAKGKYVLVLGDDDFLINGMLEKLILKLSDGDYGLIHLHPRLNSNLSDEIFSDPNLFLEKISFWITYITSNIVNSKYIKHYDFEKYSGTFLTILPLYITAAIEHNRNLMVYDRVFSDGIDINTNGGYNFFEVFLVNYLNLWKEFKIKGKIHSHLYYFIKKDIFNKFLVPNAYTLLVKKSVNSYSLENSWFSFLKYYSLHFYFYKTLILFTFKRLIKKINVE